MEDLAAPALDVAEPHPVGGQFPEVRVQRPGGEFFEDLPDDREGLDDLLARTASRRCTSPSLKTGTVNCTAS